MLISDGKFAVFMQRPISAALLIFAFILLGVLIFPSIRKAREKALKEED